MLRLLKIFAVFTTLTLIIGCSGGGGSETSSNPTPDDPGPARPPQSTQIPGPRPEIGPRSYVLFESGQVRPLALVGEAYLAATNTPDNHLEIFSVQSTGLEHCFSIPVGLEPVSVAAHANGLVWVVNHLSDSVSVIDMQLNPPRVVQTLWVGDEPRDIVFGGAAYQYAFITTAHRGQNSPVEPRLETPGIGRADVWVFDTSRDRLPDQQPMTIINLFCDRARALEVSADGMRVYAAAFLSGNRTTVLGPPQPNKQPPHDSADGVQAPSTGLILRHNGTRWTDETGANYNAGVPFSLPDYDLFTIDASLDPPSLIARTPGIGTIIFNLAVDPEDGSLFASNIESLNHIRFAGKATRASSSVRGHLADNRVSIIEQQTVVHRDLNTHLDYTTEFGSDSERALSLSMPSAMAIDNGTLYLCAFGSAKLAFYPTAGLKAGQIPPTSDSQILLRAGGPSGLVIDATHRLAYVLTRFDNGISTIDLTTHQEIEHVTMVTPEPQHIVAGRRFLYDASYTSSRGNDSCATCHIFGDTDGLAWDLGDPDAEVTVIPNTFITISAPAAPYLFHPMKGPMTTQSMRGIRGHGPMHWRGDRTGTERGPGETIEEAAFKEFNEAFDALLARREPLTDEEMQTFTDFAMELSYPPNPVRRLDNQLTDQQAFGEQLYNNGIIRGDTGAREVCVTCHPIIPEQGTYGTRGLMSDNSQPGERNFKIPHFRDQYQKVGMFGWGYNSPPVTGPQVRGFGYNHNGATSGNYALADTGIPADQVSALRQFLFAFPSESAPILGQQITLTKDPDPSHLDRVDLMVERALVIEPVPEVDLIAQAFINDQPLAWLMDEDGFWHPDSAESGPRSLDALLELLSRPNDRITFTCVPWGSGRRMALDRDQDGVLNGDESL